jgi:membrane-associated protein
VDQIIQQAISLTGSFNLWLILTIFMIALIAEFGLGIPYLLETIWLLVGYHAIGGTISPASIIICCTISLVGREIGAVALYHVSRSRINPLPGLVKKAASLEFDSKASPNLLKKHILLPVIKRLVKLFYSCSPVSDEIRREYLIEKYVQFSAFNVALGRFSWLKIPITITMGVARRPMTLFWGIAVFSIAWDGLYISLGAFGADKINPLILVTATISGFMVINSALFFIRRYVQRHSKSI